MDFSSWLDKILSDPLAIATLVLALVTAILAGASFWTIRQNHVFRIKDIKSRSRKRALDEILSWALDAVKIITSNTVIDSVSRHHLAVQLKTIETQSIISVAESSNLYAELSNQPKMKGVSHSIELSARLQDNVEAANKTLGVYIGDLETKQSNNSDDVINKFKQVIATVANLRTQLDIVSEN